MELLPSTKFKQKKKIIRNEMIQKLIGQLSFGEKAFHLRNISTSKMIQELTMLPRKSKWFRIQKWKLQFMFECEKLLLVFLNMAINIIVYMESSDSGSITPLRSGI
jgi:hypothetical protein